MNKPARVAASDAFKARFTTAEFLRMGETGAFDDMKMELVEGELERMNPPQTAHAGRQARITIRLARLIAETRLFGEVGIDLGDDTLLACDIAVTFGDVAANRMLTPNEVCLVVEVAETTAARDRGMKRLAYARAGIPLYWVVDGQRAVTHVYHELNDGDYAQIATVRFGEPLAVPGTASTIVID